MIIRRETKGEASVSGSKGTKSCTPKSAHKIRKVHRGTKESFLKVHVNLCKQRSIHLLEFGILYIHICTCLTMYCFKYRIKFNVLIKIQIKSERKQFGEITLSFL